VNLVNLFLELLNINQTYQNTGMHETVNKTFFLFILAAFLSLDFIKVFKNNLEIIKEFFLIFPDSISKI